MTEEHHRRLDATTGDSTGVTTTDDEAVTSEVAGPRLETAESTVRYDEDQGPEYNPQGHPPMTPIASSRDAGDISTTLDQTFIAVMRALVTEGARADQTTGPTDLIQASQEIVRNTQGTAQGGAHRVLGQPVGLADRHCPEAEWPRHPPLHRLQDGQRGNGDPGVRHATRRRLAHGPGDLPVALLARRGQRILGYPDDSTRAQDFSFCVY
ncbi:hypothetical protein ON010_g4876 [Phytophthora cinnamomi]|nr:hypothetical protein ON010_g4876 [Phytophthora cinnamomi]